MTPVKMTRKQLEALKADSSKVKVRRTAKGAYHTKCMACGVEFHTVAAENRHLDETRHARYQLIQGH